MKFGRREIGEIVRYLLDRKTSLASQTVATAQIVPKMCQDDSPTMYSRFHPNRFTFGTVIAKHANTAKSHPKVIQYSSEAISSSRVKIKTV